MQTEGLRSRRSHQLPFAAIYFEELGYNMLQLKRAQSQHVSPEVTVKVEALVGPEEDQVLDSQPM